MPIRDAKTPSGTELDQLATVTEADVEDAVTSLKRRVPEARRAVEATSDSANDGDVTGPIPDVVQ